MSWFLFIRQDLKSFWYNSRSAIGARWAWLQRNIAELNKQIYRLDHHLKGHGKSEFSWIPPSTVTTTAGASALFPQYFSIANGTVLEHLRTNGGGHATVGKAGGKHGGNNGYSHHHSTEHAQCLPHLLLPEALLGAKLQVKDLLSPTVEKSLLYKNEATCTSARTR